MNEGVMAFPNIGENPQALLRESLLLPGPLKALDMAHGSEMAVKTSGAQAWDHRVSAQLDKFPFADGTMDLIRCRRVSLCAVEPDRLLSEAARVLRQGGLVVLADVLAPAGNRKPDREARQWFNAFFQLANPDHKRALDKQNWHRLLYQAGFTLEAEEASRRSIQFGEWAAALNVSPINRMRLQAMLTQVPEIVAPSLTPTLGADRITFSLSELLLVARKMDSHAQRPRVKA